MDDAAEAPAPQGPTRDLLARLYREIGLAAVAAALSAPEAGNGTAAEAADPEQEASRQAA